MKYQMHEIPTQSRYQRNQSLYQHLSQNEMMPPALSLWMLKTVQGEWVSFETLFNPSLTAGLMQDFTWRAPISLSPAISLKQEAHTSFPGMTWAEQAQQFFSSAWASDKAINDDEDLLLLCLHPDLLFLEALRCLDLSWFWSKRLQ